ncbi:MAG: hypothetical protein CVT65_14190 [Actinobacteria bacterium HGW-Actinobacteria-5]|jgi:hypothetical protein|nr:MAG: hypothetical protein CVT65_14190 [Actinobacteria bacterium HGW-Actinobacteria-5]
MLAGIGVAICVGLAGLSIAVWSLIVEPAPVTPPVAVNQTEPTAVSVRDRIAAAPMASVDPDAAFSPDPATDEISEIVVPIASIEAGPSGVPSGFPRTPQGAVGQLAAIEKTVLESMSLPALRDIHQAWVQPGGPDVEVWELTRDVETFLAAGRQGGQTKDVTTLVQATPAAAMVKGVDGPDWTLACVLMDVQVAIRTEARMGYGFCARMQWDPTGQRWLIAVGAPPAAAPSTWPGSRAAVAAGWQTWVEEVER